MKKIADFIVDKRYFILVLFIALAGFGILLSTKVNINSDITKYLPKNSETRQGMDIMEKEFEEEKKSTLYVMFDNISGQEDKILKQLQQLDNVSSVEYDDTEEYNLDEHTLYILHVDDYASSKAAKNLYDTISEKYRTYKVSFSGSIAEENQPVLGLWIIILAIVFAVFILIIMCDSYVEPFLFLFTIGLAVFINKGTNIIFPSVSNITESICAILQMALSMDYSIMLMNRYTQEKKHTLDKENAMKNALEHAFGSISSSSVTTIVGLMALVFMSFTIGKDLGYVLAKGVLLSLLSIFTVLPGLIIIFDNLINKTRKRKIEFKMTKLGVIAHNFRYVALGIFVLVFILSYFLKGNLKILYTTNENDKVKKVFNQNNQMAIIYNNKDEKEVSNICKNISGDEVVEVLCYGNTINEKLTYNKLNKKLIDLGNDVEIEDYLLKLVFYKYYANSKLTQISTMELINFIENDVYSKEKLDKHVDNEMKENIERLKYFANPSEINKLRTPKELATILGIDESSISKILMLHHAKITNTRININQFVNYVYTDVINNPTFSGNIDSSTKSDLDTLKKFIDKNTLYTQIDSKTMAGIFGIDENSMSKLYLYYYSIYGVDTTLTMHEFSSFIINDVLTNPLYSSLFDEEAINKLKQLNTFSDITITSKEMNAKELSELLEVQEEQIKLLLLLKEYDGEDTNTYTLKEISNISVEKITNIIEEVKENPDYFENIDKEQIQKIIDYIKNKNIKEEKFSKEELEKIDKELTDKLYEELELSEDEELTLLEYLELIKEKITENYNSIEEKINNIINLYQEDRAVDYKELANITGIDAKYTKALYTVIEVDDKELTSTPKDIIDYLLENKDNELISDFLDDEKITSLEKLQDIINKSNNRYNYQTMSNVIGLDFETTKKLYALYKSNKETLTLNKMQVINFILDHRYDNELSNIDKETFNKLEKVRNILNGVNNNATYSSDEMSNALNISTTKMRMLYSYYDISNGYIENISLKEFTDFILTDVMTNSEYNRSFDNSSRDKLATVNSLMNDSLNNVKYTSMNFYDKVSPLNENLEYNMVDLIYLYFGSVNNYSDKYKLTVEEFINYLNSDILTDEEFDKFIDSSMRKDIKNGKKSIDKAKKLLVGDNYSRVVINTNYKAEANNTFEFIKDLKRELKSLNNDNYVIGNSPMAYDLNSSFGKEFNFISILTMILIFIVVAVTFKSIIIPFVLTLIIQTAVYITMSILSLLGGDVYFISLLIVQSILMGATIDYAILYTSYYIELRGTYNKKGALINAYNKSLHTILTSALILIIVTFVVGFFANAITAKICMTISQGTISSLILVVFMLPPILASLDKVIVHKN